MPEFMFIAIAKKASIVLILYRFIPRHPFVLLAFNLVTGTRPQGRPKPPPSTVLYTTLTSRHQIAMQCT